MKEDMCEVSKEALKVMLEYVKMKMRDTGGKGDNYPDISVFNAYKELCISLENQNDQD